MTESEKLSANRAGAVLARLSGAGFTPIAPPILQPANVFLDLTGEDIRRRLFLTLGTDGEELCLRPDFTIPVCRAHLESGDALRSASYCYTGPVFRQRAGEIGEIPQAGAESLGRADEEAADADMLAHAIDALDAGGAKDITIRIGDETLFSAVLSNVGLPTVWQRRLRSLFGESATLMHAISRMAGLAGHEDEPRGVRTGFLAALEGAEPGAARDVVEDLLSIAGIDAVGGRTAGEIAERFLEQAALASGSGAYKTQADILSRYLAIKGSPREAMATLEAFSSECAIDLNGPFASFKKRLDVIEAKGIDMSRIEFAADFGRRLDYYTGFVFEIHAKHKPTEAALQGPLVGGGRYDRLVKLLGAPQEVPAVGFSMWLDRIAASTGAEA